MKKGASILALPFLLDVSRIPLLHLFVVDVGDVVVGVVALLTCACVSQWYDTKLHKNIGSASYIGMRFDVVCIYLICLRNARRR